jgi:hypothetical protein
VLQLPLGTFVFASMSRVCVGKELGLAVQRARAAREAFRTSNDNISAFSEAPGSVPN